MAATLGERLVEAEINPLFVMPLGKGVKAADGGGGAGVVGAEAVKAAGRAENSWRLASVSLAKTESQQGIQFWRVGSAGFF